LGIARHGAGDGSSSTSPMIFVGYAALFLSFAASLLYLLQERSLKAKKPPRFCCACRPLEVIDQIGYRSLLLGVPCMTLGLVDGKHRGPGHLWAAGPFSIPRFFFHC